MASLLTAPQLQIARCAHFGTCGGCRFQTTPYAEQLLQKELFVKQLFEGMEGEWSPILACELPWNYRNKMEFSFSMSRQKERFLGLMIKGARGKVVNLTECHLAPPWMAEVLQEVRTWWETTDLTAYHPHTDTGTLRTLTCRFGVRTGMRMVILTVSGREDYALSDDHLRSFSQSVKKCEVNDSIILRKHITQRGVPTRFEEKVLQGSGTIYEVLYAANGRQLKFKIRPSSFFQPNTIKAERLYQRALELAELTSGDVLLDLYCGTGTIGIFASLITEKVIGIELNPEAVHDARDNIALNQVTGMEVREQDAGKSLALESPPTTIIVDPPRPGLSPEAIRTIVGFAPKKILYISCNPVTQASNVKDFLKEGYLPYAFQPVDQFPHTQHVENIVALVRSF